MIEKKNPNLDLEGKRNFFLQVGMLAVGSLTLAAFTYKSPNAIEEELRLVEHRPVEYQTEIVEKPETLPIKTLEMNKDNNDDQSQDQQTVDMQKSIDENSKQKKNEEKKVLTKVGLKDLGYEFGDLFDLNKRIEGEIVAIPDKDAEFIGGTVEMKKFINDRIVYPELAIQFNEQGTVWVSFVVETDGAITGIGIERGVSEDLNNEALRIVRKFPKWKPGEVEAQPVRTRVRLPITFILEK